MTIEMNNNIKIIANDFIGINNLCFRRFFFNLLSFSVSLVRFYGLV